MNEYVQKLEIREDSFEHFALTPPLARAIAAAAKRNGINVEQAEAHFKELFTLKQRRPVSGTIIRALGDDEDE